MPDDNSNPNDNSTEGWKWSEAYRDSYRYELDEKGNSNLVWAKEKRKDSVYSMSSAQLTTARSSQITSAEYTMPNPSYGTSFSQSWQYNPSNSNSYNIPTPYPVHYQQAPNPQQHPASPYQHAPTQGAGPQANTTPQGGATGGWVTGTSGEKERLDASYRVRKDAYKFFEDGRMFAVLFTENAGSTVTNYNDSISEVKYQGEYAHTQIRRFIVVHRRPEFCYACPVFTYSGRATLKSGVRPSEHAIVYTEGYKPTLVAGEVQLEKMPIGVTPASTSSGHSSGHPLQIASRIYFGIHHPIQFNVKVKNLGKVTRECMPYLTGYWSQGAFGLAA